MRRAGWAWPATALVIALGLRSIHLWTIFDSPFFSHLSLDPLVYDEWGWRIAQGDWLGDRIFYQDPLYPYFLGVLYTLFGRHYAGVVFVQLVMGSLVAPLIFFATSRWFGRPAALAASVLAATYAPSIYYDGLILKTWLEAFLAAAALGSLSRAAAGESARAWGVTGFLLGLGCLVRANLLLLIPVLALWVVLDPSATSDPRSRRHRRVPWRALLGLAVGPALVLGSSALRNRVVGGEWVLTTAQAGQNFYLGNNPWNQTGGYQPLPFVRPNPKHEEKDFASEAERRVGRAMRPSEVSRFWFREALGWIRAHPLDWLRLTWRKLRLYWGAYEVPDNLDYYLYMDSAPVLRLPLVPGFGLIAPLGVTGALLALRMRGWPRALLLILLAYCASVLLFYVFARYRIAMMPVLFPLAGHAVIETARRLRAWYLAGSGAMPALRAMGCALALLAFVNLPVRAPADYWSYRLARMLNLPAREETPAMAHFNLGVTYAKEAKESDEPDRLLALAASELRESLRLDPNQAKVHEELGKVLARMDRDREAIDAYLRSLQIEARRWRAHHALGLLYRRVGDAAAAEACFREAMALEPRQPESPIELGELLLEEGRRADAAEAFRRALAIAPSSEPARRGLETALRLP